MDSSNIPYKSHLQNHQLIICSSDSCNYPAAAAAAGNNPHVWTPNIFLSSSDMCITSDEALINLRNPRLLQNDNIVTSFNNPSILSTKDFGLELSSNFIQEEDHYNLHLNNSHIIKQEVLNPNYGRFFINPSSRTHEDSLKIKNACYSNYVKEMKEVDDQHTCTVTSSSSSRSKQSCGQIYPTINVSEILTNQQLPGGGSSMGINSSNANNYGFNFQSLDLFNSSRFGGNFHQQQTFQEDLEFSKNSCIPYGMDFMKQSLGNTFESGYNMEFINKRVAESKKYDVNSETKTDKTQVGTKRSRSIETRACPPLKVFQVRKEKLGDRVAALQQLVAPFGKTDTASVLMEAIGYIKFLHNQVETLSVPYLKSSRHKNNRAAHHGDYIDSESEERKQNLKSKGLCLVPLSCLSYVADGGGGAMWPPPHFG